MFGKFFASTFTGSMMGAGPNVFAVWSYAIAHAVNGQVELNPKYLAAVIGTAETMVEKAIEYLAAPDPRSRSKDEDGRRLIKEGEFAYRVVNHAKYLAIRDESGRREYMREYIREYRKAGKGSVNICKHDVNTVNKCKPCKPPLAHTDTDTEADTVVCTTNSNIVPPYPPKPETTHTTPQIGKEEKKEAKPEPAKNAPTLGEAVEYFRKSKYSNEEVKRTWQSFSSTAVEGIWFWGKRQITDWRHAMECRLGEYRDTHPNANTSRGMDQLMANVEREVEQSRREMLKELKS